MGKLSVGILGATGAAGLEFVRALTDHPLFQIERLYASEKSAGKTLEEATKLDVSDVPSSIRRLAVEDVGNVSQGLDLICSALDSKIAKSPEADAAIHTPVISTTSAHRYEQDVPVMITEINGDHYPLLERQRSRGWKGWIAPGPNCTTVGLVMSLYPIYKELGIKRVIMTSSQSVSGGGTGLLKDWERQRTADLPMPLQEYSGEGQLIEGNVIGNIPGEVEKVKRETRKILGALEEKLIVPADIGIDAQCTRVPVYAGHFETVVVETGKSAIVARLREIYDAYNAQFRSAFGNLHSSPDKTYIILDGPPQPRLHVSLGGGMSAVIGMIDKSEVFDNGFTYQVLSHNLQRGAAKGIVHLAEYLHSINFLRPKA